MLLLSSRAYILYQVFDYVHRSPSPVRFVKLYENLEDLEAWPNFREYAINDPRFLVVGDTIDIATAGIHSSASQIEIISQSLDLLYVPMTDYTLNRLVKRLRPILTDDNPAEKASEDRGFFRPQKQHLARIKWLSRGKVLQVRAEWLISPGSAAYKLIKEAKQAIKVADLSVTLAEHFGLVGIDAYSLLACDNRFLLLPDGNICLYDDVIDNILLNKDSKKLDIPEKVDIAVPLAEEVQSIELPDDLDELVAQLSRESKKPISTERILSEFLKIPENDSNYVTAFRKVTSYLGYSSVVIPVSSNTWFAMDAVPTEVFWWQQEVEVKNPIKADLPAPVSASSTSIHILPDRKVPANFYLHESHIENGCLSWGQGLQELLPDSPMIQVYEWMDSSVVWYNTETKTLFGLKDWLQEKRAQRGDTVKVDLQNGRLLGTLYKQTTKEPESRNYPKTRAIPRETRQNKSLLNLVIDILAASGGRLEKSQLVKAVRTSAPAIDWPGIAPLFERYPLLRTDASWCWLAERPKAGRSSLAAQRESSDMMRNLPESVYNHPEVSYLVSLVTIQEKLTGTEEKVLIGKALDGSEEAEERLILSHLRMVLGYLLQRNDIEELLREISDYFQIGVMGLMRAVKNFDPTRAERLHQATGWYIKGAIDRATTWNWVVRFPDHFYQKLDKCLNKIDEPEGSKEQEDVETPLVEFWASVQWEDWDSVLEEYEEGLEDIISFVANEDEVTVHIEEAVLDKLLISELLTKLKPKEADIISRYYGLTSRGKTYEEIASIYDVTRSRIQQIHHKAMNKLRDYLIKLADQ